MDKLFTTRTSSLFSVSFWNFATVCPVWMIRVSRDRLDIAIRVLPSPKVWYPFSANNPRQFAGRLCVVIHPSWVPVARGLSFAVTQSTVVCDIGGKVTVSRENSETDATTFATGSVIIGMRLGSVPNVTLSSKYLDPSLTPP